MKNTHAVSFKTLFNLIYMSNFTCSIFCQTSVKRKRNHDVELNVDEKWNVNLSFFERHFIFYTIELGIRYNWGVAVRFFNFSNLTYLNLKVN